MTFSETQRILTPSRFELLGFAISIYTNSLLKIRVFLINKRVVDLYRSTQPTFTIIARRDRLFHRYPYFNQLSNSGLSLGERLSKNDGPLSHSWLVGLSGFAGSFSGGAVRTA